MANWFNDLHHAIRQMKKAPGFTLVVMITLALGIGANTTVFSIVDAVMLRPLPYFQPQRLIEVQSSQENTAESSNVSYPDFFDWRSQNRTLDHLVSYHDTGLTLTGVAQAIHLHGQVVSWNLLPTLGVHPELGRGFLPRGRKARNARPPDQPCSMGISIRVRQVGSGPQYQPERGIVHSGWRDACVLPLSCQPATEQLLDNLGRGRRSGKPKPSHRQPQHAFSKRDRKTKAWSHSGAGGSGF